MRKDSESLGLVVASHERPFHSVVVLQSLGEPPIEEQHVELEEQVDDQRHNEDNEERMPPGITKGVWHGRRCRIASLRRTSP